MLLCFSFLDSSFSTTLSKESNICLLSDSLLKYCAWVAAWPVINAADPSKNNWDLMPVGTSCNTNPNCSYGSIVIPSSDCPISIALIADWFRASIAVGSAPNLSRAAIYCSYSTFGWAWAYSLNTGNASWTACWNILWVSELTCAICLIAWTSVIRPAAKSWWIWDNCAWASSAAFWTAVWWALSAAWYASLNDHPVASWSIYSWVDLVAAMFWSTWASIPRLTLSELPVNWELLCFIASPWEALWALASAFLWLTSSITFCCDATSPLAFLNSASIILLWTSLIVPTIIAAVVTVVNTFLTIGSGL